LEKDGKRFAENLLEEVIKSQRHVTKGNNTYRCHTNSIG